MTAAPTIPKDLLHFFVDAMANQTAVTDYAASLGLPSEVFSPIFGNATNPITQQTLLAIATALGQEVVTLHAALANIAANETFAAWFAFYLNDMHQATIRARAKLDAPHMRAIVRGKALPDADQAERLSRVLVIPRTDMARAVIGDIARRIEALPLPVAEHEAAPDVAKTTTRKKKTVQPPALVTTTIEGQVTASPVLAPPPAAAPATFDIHQDDSTETALVDELPQGLTAAVAPPPTRRPGRPPKAVVAPADAPEAGSAHAPPETNAGATAQATTASAALPPRPQRTSKKAAAAAATAPSNARATNAEPLGVAVAPAAVLSNGQHEAAASPASPLPGTQPDAALPATPAEASTAAAPTAIVAAEVLQLSPEEARLLKRWRQLHAHGQRATMQYIGLLLVDE